MAEAVPHHRVLAVDAEGDRRAVLEPDGDVVAGLGVLERVEGAVVEDVAVLVDLDERRAVVLGRRPSTDVRCLRSESIVRATKLASAPMASEIGPNGASTEPIGVDFVLFPSSDVGEYCPLVSP